jgi:hypothetical protein
LQSLKTKKPIKIINMKKVILSLFVVASLATLTSCKKCVTCTVSGSIMGVPVNSTSEEKCGKKKDIDAEVKKCKDKAAAAGLTCSCENS